MRIGMSLTALVLAGALFSCSSDPTPTPSCSDAVIEPTKAPASFSRDVVPVFQKSCAFSTCHGATTGPANGVFLGNDPARVHAGIVGVKSGENPSMNFVTAGDPHQSYLMRKMDGSQCALDAQCKGGSCDGSMPKNDVTLPAETRDIVRRWIAQGAKND